MWLGRNVRQRFLGWEHAGSGGSGGHERWWVRLEPRSKIATPRAFSWRAGPRRLGRPNRDTSCKKKRDKGDTQEEQDREWRATARRVTTTTRDEDEDDRISLREKKKEKKLLSQSSQVLFSRELVEFSSRVCASRLSASGGLGVIQE